MEVTMLERYTDAIMNVIDMRDDGFPTANTRIEVKRLLKEYFVEENVARTRVVAESYLDAEERINKIERGESL
jgi:hypothetical protein